MPPDRNAEHPYRICFGQYCAIYDARELDLLWDALRESRLLVCRCLLDFTRCEISGEKLGMEVVQLNALDHVKRVDNITETLAHLAALTITDQTVAEDLLERNLSRQLFAEHDHTSNPELEIVSNDYLRG